MVAVRGRNVDDVNVGICNQLGVGAVGGGVGGAVNGLEERGTAVSALEGGDGGDLVGYIVDVAGGRVREEILAEGWMG